MGESWNGRRRRHRRRRRRDDDVVVTKAATTTLAATTTKKFAILNPVSTFLDAFSSLEIGSHTWTLDVVG